MDTQKYPPSEWVYIDKSVCQRCGKRGSTTEHHEKKDGKKTGRVTYLCRDCHNLVEGIINRDEMTKIVAHGAQCEGKCHDLLLEIRSHMKGVPD